MQPVTVNSTDNAEQETSETASPTSCQETVVNLESSAATCEDFTQDNVNNSTEYCSQNEVKIMCNDF